MASHTNVAWVGDHADVGVLHIRDFDDGLQRRLRIAASVNDTTMKAIVEEAVARELARLERESENDR
jgi:plasmid stability protein